MLLRAGLILLLRFLLLVGHLGKAKGKLLGEGGNRAPSLGITSSVPLNATR